MDGRYKGDVSVEDCWSSLAETPDALLVDVRTIAEWTYVGLPVLTPAGKAPILIEWQRFPAMSVDPDFTARLSSEVEKAGGGKSSPLFFLCRSGVRSMASAAAATAMGYENAFNILDGFEGPADEEGHRGRLAGWKAKGLPWAQK